MKHVLTIISCIAVLSMSAQETIFDTIPSEYLACEGQSFKMLWLPSYVSVYDSEESWYVAIQNYLDLSDYAGATLIHAQYQEILSNNCWCWYDPEFMTSYDPVSCDCCGGDATRPFVDYIIVSYQANPCNYLGSHAQELLCSGCTAPSAVNYDENALYDDGSCEFAEDFNGIAADLDFDGVVGVADLLILLAAFGDTDLDFDGIYDSIDDCVGEYDECGICNGSGPSIPVIESIEILYDSVYAEAIDEWWVFEVGTDTTFQLVCSVIEGCTDPTSLNFNEEANVDDGSCLSCGASIDYNGYSYNTVQIGSQCWFAENLRTNYYGNGEPIPTNLSDENWFSTDQGAFAHCDDNASIADASGNLYNWWVIEDPRGICPSFWSVPSDDQWMQLEVFLGMPDDELYNEGTRGTSEGSALKSETWGGNNATGFSAIPGGNRHALGFYQNCDDWAHFWTSSEYGGSNAWERQLYYSSSGIVRHEKSKSHGQSIRCIKD